jgi:hypothetical protein
MILSNAARACAIALSIGAAPVAKASTLSLLVAAGGGGGGVPFDIGGPGLITENGGSNLGPNDGAGGTAGLGGGAGDPFSDGGGGGGGWLSPGGSATNGGGGGQSSPTFAGGGGTPTAGAGPGGFGGGGGGGFGGGGGGGYSGGGGGGSDSASPVGADSGAGGGSYIASELFNVLTSAGYNGNGLQSAADGYVIVGFQVFNYTGTVFQFTIPQTGNWWVAAVGAQGGNTGGLFSGNGGYGAAVGGDIFLTEGTLLDILAGGAGIDAGGGGGSFVWDPAPLPQQPVPIPEPSTWTMMLLGLAGLGFAGYRRARVGRATLSAGAFTASR